jgi:hypothetical protein
VNFSFFDKPFIADPMGESNDTTKYLFDLISNFPTPMDIKKIPLSVVIKEP